MQKLQILIHGIKDGKHKFQLSIESGDLEFPFDEFFGIVNVSGELKKIGKRFYIEANADCMTKLICDRTLVEFEYLVNAQIKQSYVIDNELYNHKNDNINENSEFIVIHEDERFIDLSNEVREQLSVAIPMKRLAPGVENKELEEIYPEFVNKNSINDIEDERWTALKNLKFN